MNFSTEHHEDGTGLDARIPHPSISARLPATTPAIELMTDFQAVLALTVAPERHIDDALKDMIVGGVRALLVTQGGRMVGLVTAADILGERPIQFLQDPTCDGTPCRHSDIHVRDIMTPRNQLQTLAFEEVRSLSVAEVSAAFRRSALTHVLIMQTMGAGEAEVRGILSRSRIARECIVES